MELFKICEREGAFVLEKHSCNSLNSGFTGWLTLERTSGGHLAQSPSSSRGIYSQLPWTMSSWLLIISKDWYCTTSLGNLCQCLVPLTVNKCFLMFRLCVSISFCAETQSAFQFVHVAFCPVTGHQWKEPDTVVFTPKGCKGCPPCTLPLGICTLLMRFPWPPLLQAEQSQLSQPFHIQEMLQSLLHLSGSLLDSLQCVHVSLVPGSPEVNTGPRVWPHQCWAGGKHHLPWPAGFALPNAAQDTIRLLTGKGTFQDKLCFSVTFLLFSKFTVMW